MTRGGPGLERAKTRWCWWIRRRDSALALLVARVSAADDHDPAMPPDDPAVVADPLDARLDLHGVPNSRCAPLHGSDSPDRFLGTDTDLLVAVDDAPASQVIRRQLDDDSVLGQDADVVLPHLPADVRQDLVAIGEFHPEHGVREWLDHSALDLNGAVFFGHVLRYLTIGLGVTLASFSRTPRGVRASRGSGLPLEARGGMP